MFTTSPLLIILEQNGDVFHLIVDIYSFPIPTISHRDNALPTKPLERNSATCAKHPRRI